MQAHSQDSGSSSAPRRRRRIVGMSVHHEQRLKRELRAAAPSEPWVEAQFRRVLDADQDGTPIIYNIHDPHVFPPGQEDTAMRICPKCGIYMPPNAFEHGACLDHASHEGWGPSPSALAIAALQRYNLRLDDMPMEPEDAASLHREIREWLAPTPPTAKIDTNL